LADLFAQTAEGQVYIDQFGLQSPGFDYAVYLPLVQQDTGGAVGLASSARGLVLPASGIVIAII
jgi:hypothetical protein